MSQAERSFGEIHFGRAELGNKARTKRLVQVADALTRHPGGTLPQKINDPMALQAMYRLMNRPEVTHASVLAAHQLETQQRIAAHAGPLLAICDATELDYSGLDSLEELGQIGNGTCRGYVCHNVLIVDPATRSVLGLANQILHTRVAAPQETRKEAAARESRESRLWLQGTEPLPGDPKLITVFDRGGDTFEALEHEAHSGRRFVIRSTHNRQVLAEHTGQARQQPLRQLVRKTKAVGSFELEVPAQDGPPARTAKLQYSYTALRVLPPRNKRGQHGNQPLALWVVRVWESDPPRGAEPLEWFLLTNEPIDGASAARQVITWYECRWIVEEYHKAMKTGCDIEHMQFTHVARLEPMIALQSIVALTLLNLRDVSRRADAKTTPARTVVAEPYIEALSLWRHGEVHLDWTIHEFYFALARLGGHQNRKGDKQPGWIVLWRGWTSLQLLATGLQLQNKRKKVG
ncbi:MAG TPA: IS4 family transposase [Pirellulales bacterium]|nr:IS4 family transposase [Pirellulales bacterium]